VIATIAILAAIAAPAPKADAPIVVKKKQDCNTHRCERRVAEKRFKKHQTVLRRRCGRGNVVACIDRAANLYRVDKYMLRRKAQCESHLQTDAYNPSGAMGLFQFMGSTWASTPYGKRGKSVWHPKWASLGAAWMHRVGRGGEWVCQ
jgi:soluble lytic murein transglycosylase-like protein